VVTVVFFTVTSVPGLRSNVTCTRVRSRHVYNERDRRELVVIIGHVAGESSGAGIAERWTTLR